VEGNLSIEKKDMQFVREQLKDRKDPVPLEEVLEKLAFFKTQDKRRSKVKVYQPQCEYKVGDLIFKEYHGSLPIGARKQMEFNRGVVLKVVEVRQAMGRHEIRLEYDGTSDYRKYIQYLERQKIELLLPHRQGKVVEKPVFLEEERDPREKQSPMLNRDMNRLSRLLVSAAGKEADLVLIAGHLLLTGNLVPIHADVFERIKVFLQDNRSAVSTEFLVENFLSVPPDKKEFSATCFSLSHRMRQDYKIDFHPVSPEGWGKWHLISVVYYRHRDSLISKTNPLLRTLRVRKEQMARRRQFEEELFADDPSRYHLTQREISAGALRLRGDQWNPDTILEVTLEETEARKQHHAFMYPGTDDVPVILGLGEVYKRVGAVQGMTLNLEAKPGESRHFLLQIRTTKRGVVADQVVYNPEQDLFELTGEKEATTVNVNKTMYLEPEVFRHLAEQMGTFREMTLLKELVHKVFLEFGAREKNFEMHVLRLYHILDLIYPISLRKVMEVLLGHPEFVCTDRGTGVYYLDSDAVEEIVEEERSRRQLLVEEAKKRREEQRKQMLEEEKRQEEEIRRVREERRIRREEEMRLKERLYARSGEDMQVPVEDVDPRTIVPRRDYVQITPSDIDMEQELQGFSDFSEYGGHDGAYEGEDEMMETAPDAEETPTEGPVEERDGHGDEDKGGRKKRGGGAPKERDDEEMSIEELREEMELAELKEQVQEKRGSAKPEDVEQVAYQDQGSGFGAIFASKLETVVGSENGERKK